MAFLPNGTKSLIEPKSSGIHLKEISQEMFTTSILDIRLKIINLRLHLHLPGVNELNQMT